MDFIVYNIKNGGDSLKIYEVKTEYYNNGVIKSNLKEFECDKIPCNTGISTSECDIYKDYFTDKAEAKRNLLRN